MRVALSIAGSDPTGGAGLQLDLQVFRALGVHGAGVLTALTIQDTKKVHRVLPAFPSVVADQLRALLAMDHITAELPSIRVPVLLIGGDRDPSLRPMKVMHRKIRGSRLVVLSPASHFANRDQPERWNRAALDFLAKVDGASRR